MILGKVVQEPQEKLWCLEESNGRQGRKVGRSQITDRLDSQRRRSVIFILSAVGTHTVKMAVFCLELLFQALFIVWCFKASASSLEFIIETVNNPPKKFLRMWPWTAVWESRRRAGKTAGHCCSRKDTSPGSAQPTRWESEADNLRRVLPFWFSFRHPETQAVLLHENSEHRRRVC